MFTAETRSIVVSVRPAYLEDQSEPEQARWVAEERTVLAELDDGAIIVEWAFKGVRYLVKEILKEAGDAAVLEPADVREAVLVAAERLLAPSPR